MCPDGGDVFRGTTPIPSRVVVETMLPSRSTPVEDWYGWGERIRTGRVRGPVGIRRL